MEPIAVNNKSLLFLNAQLARKRKTKAKEVSAPNLLQKDHRVEDEQKEEKSVFIHERFKTVAEPVSLEYDPSKPNDYDALVQMKRSRKEQEWNKNVYEEPAIAEKSEKVEKEEWPIDEPMQLDYIIEDDYDPFGYATPVQTEPATLDLEMTGEEAYERRQRMTKVPVILAPPIKQKKISDQSNVILIRNLVEPGETDDLLETETKQQCEKYGKVLDCVVYETKKAPMEVRVFVQFESFSEANNAFNALKKKKFQGRLVQIDFYDQELFESFELDE